MTDSYFTFNEETHTYRLGSVVIPSVTQVLKDLRLTPAFPPGPYRVRGRQVHKACEIADLNTLHLYDIGEGLMGFVTAWRAVCREFGWVWEADEIEQRVYDPIRLTAGTIDRVRWREPHLIVDIKSGAAAKEAALQTAGYAVMAFPDHPEKVQRCSVEIDSDGTFKPPTWYENPQDIAAWKGAVELWKWMNRKGK